MPILFLPSGQEVRIGKSFRPYRIADLLDEKSNLFDKDGKEVRCLVCGGPLTPETVAVLGGKFIHNHVRICESYIYSFMYEPKDKKVKKIESSKTKSINSN